MSCNQVRIPIAVDLLEKSKAPQTSLPQFSAILIKIIDLFYSDFDSFGLKLRFSHSPALLPDILREFGSHGRTVACVQPPSPFEQGVAVHRLFVGVRGGGGGGESREQQGMWGGGVRGGGGGGGPRQEVTRLRLGNPPVHIISHFNLITFTLQVGLPAAGHLIYPGSPTSMYVCRYACKQTLRDKARLYIAETVFCSPKNI